MRTCDDAFGTRPPASWKLNTGTIPIINTNIKKEGFIFDIKIAQGKEVKAR